MSLSARTITNPEVESYPPREEETVPWLLTDISDPFTDRDPEDEIVYCCIEVLVGVFGAEYNMDSQVPVGSIHTGKASSTEVVFVVTLILEDVAAIVK